VESDVTAKTLEGLRCGFECKHGPAWPKPTSEQRGVCAKICADVERDHPWPDDLAKCAVLVRVPRQRIVFRQYTNHFTVGEHSSQPSAPGMNREREVIEP